MKTKRSKALVFICAFVGALLIISSVLLIACDIRSKSSAEKQMQETVKKLYFAMPENTDGVFNKEADSEEGMPVFVIDKLGYIGVLSVPALEIEVPVADEYAEYMPLRISGNAAAGSLVIGGVLNGFEAVYIGDTIQLYDMRGKVWSYSVCDVIRGEYDCSEVPEEVSLVLSFKHSSTEITVLCK